MPKSPKDDEEDVGKKKLWAIFFLFYNGEPPF
jgi:hypothetical protein